MEGGPKTIKEVAEATGMEEGNTKQLLHQMRKAGQVNSNNGVYEAVVARSTRIRSEAITPITP